LMIKRVASILVTVLLFFLFHAGVAVGEGTTPADPSFTLMDTTTGEVLVEERADIRRAPASVTKVMTMLVAMDAVSEGKVSYDDVVRVSAKAAGTGGSQIYLAEGERITLRDLMIAIVVASANDACVAVAEHIAGTENAFVALMNTEVERLGLTNTHFANSNGLPADSHYSSAYDLAMITRELVLRHPEVLEWTSMRYTTIRDGKTTLYNTNLLLGQVDGLNGLKTGHTESAGYCLSATASRGGKHRISVVMGYPTDDGRWQKTIELLEYGFGTSAISPALPSTPPLTVRIQKL
jgi:D-alanyl-D-alanine carboxypeptidase (penicillin-binding protein 5/6)